MIAFLGTSYFRFLGRGQRYGLSARGLAIGAAPSPQRGVPILSRILDRDAGCDGRACCHLCASRRRIRDRRLPHRSDPRPGDLHRRECHPVRAQADARARSCAAVVDVFRRQGRSAVLGRLPRRIARFRWPSDAHGRGRMDLAAARATRRSRRSLSFSTPTRADLASCSGTAISATTRISISLTN